MQQIVEFKTKKAALDVAVSLSKPSKMPCKGYSLPASECKVGGKLRDVCGSVCSKCYAYNRGNYIYPNVQDALRRRMEAITNPLWISAMVKLIGADPYFRWHDSGDLQSDEHFKSIIAICEATPNTKHWLPTKEKALVLRYVRKHGALPDNLTVRISAAMIDGKAPTVPPGLNTSTVHTSNQVEGFACRASSQDGKCLDCRACWDKSIDNVSYLEH